ncbi:BBT_HP_G0133420.mRNA.1.CDS.1 [Saccharomyces cerevisiae]|nr:BBT_HP_G0133420.mRNA.1.CDS.1 [Saccharomyces cerevisiae]CAI6977085.1 BBT_HP_G0133420.mRNA.1.CDS.1 [Saccharomyces cerevisiae]
MGFRVYINERIIDVEVNEGFCQGFQVIFYLAAIVRKSSTLKLLFPIVSYFNDLIRNTNTTMQSNLPNIDDQRLIQHI